MADKRRIRITFPDGSTSNDILCDAARVDSGFLRLVDFKEPTAKDKAPFETLALFAPGQWQGFYFLGFVKEETEESGNA